jgi:hypothetical protein
VVREDFNFGKSGQPDPNDGEKGRIYHNIHEFREDNMTAILFTISTEQWEELVELIT